MSSPSKNHPSTSEESPLLQAATTRDSNESSVQVDGTTAPPQSRHTNTKNKARSLLLKHFHSAYWIEALSEERRQQKLLHRNAGAAAFLIRDAVLGDAVENPAEGAFDPYNPHHNTQSSIATAATGGNSSTTTAATTIVSRQCAWAIVCSRWCSHTLLLQALYVTVLATVLVTFWEPPHWCRDFPGGGCAAAFAAQGLPVNDNGSSHSSSGAAAAFVEYYPHTNSLWLTERQARVVEVVCLVTIAVALCLRLGRDGMSIRTYLRPSTVQHNRIVQIVCVGVLACGHTAFQPYVRLALLFSFQPGAQRDIRVLIAMLPEVMNILLLLFVITLFYAWFGVVMFVDTPEGDKLFPNLIEGLWTLWICVTTANYPDVMMPGYNINRWVALYFISFMIISFFFLMNVILASVVNEYDSAEEHHQATHAEQATLRLKKAYQCLVKDKANTEEEMIDQQTVMALFKILNDDFPEFRRLPDDTMKLLFAILDSDGTGRISEDEFMNFGNVLMLDFIKSSAYDTFMETHFPRFFVSDGWQKFCSMVNASTFDKVIDGILVMNAAVVAIQSWPELSSEKVVLDEKYWDGTIDTLWEVAETIFTAIYTLEVLSKIAVLGWKKYTDQLRNVFDFTVTVVAILSTAIVYYPNDYSDSRLIRMVLVMRVLRLLRLMTALQPFELIGRISTEILPAAKSVMMVLFMTCYFYAALGMHMYGGMITRDPDNPVTYFILNPKNAPSDFADNNYWANNFNDMLSGMNVLFNLLVVNNWFVCEVGFEAATQTKWVRFFFLSFHVIGVILVNNLVIAFVINKFMSELAIYKEKNNEEIVDGEAVIQNRQAVFDAALVTGTRTSLHGAYIARLRHSNSNEQKRLRELFTRQSTDDSPSQSNEISSKPESA